MVQFPPDFLDIFDALAEQNARFLVVGAVAMSHYGYIRSTGDLDLYVDPTLENSEKVFSALKKFGAPLFEIDSTYFSKPGVVFQIGQPPLRIDFLTLLEDLAFSNAFRNALEVCVGSSVVKLLSLEDLILTKQKNPREKDAADVVELRKLAQQKRAAPK